MNNHQAVVDQIVENLAFEVEAVPKNKSIEATSISQSTPLNVKIKVRKKDDILMQHDVSSIADATPRGVQKIRLVNSDRTIMTFDVFMEAEFDKKPSRKLRKHIFDMLIPGICLGAVDDDEYPYMPNSSYSANITEPSVANKTDGTLKQTFTLSKNIYQAFTVSAQPKEQKWLFGRCKPGGCLDPPFSEDKYSYKPSIRSGPEREEQIEEEHVGSEMYSKTIPITPHDEEVQSNGKHSSIFDSGLFKKKRKSSDKGTNTKLPDTTDSIVDIYQGESAKSSASTHTNSIITYPPKVKSNPRISDDKMFRSRDPSEDKSRKSFNDHSEPYFTRPKGVNRIKEKETLDPSDYPKHRSADATDLRNSLKEPFKMPVPLPIPIPVPIPVVSNKQKPEVVTANDNILKTPRGSANVTELDATPDQYPQDHETQDAVNSKDTDITPRLLRNTSDTEDTDNKLVESSKIITVIPSNVKQPTTVNEKDDQNLHEIKLQPLKETGSEISMENTSRPSNKTKTKPFNLNEANCAPALEPKIINENLQKIEMKTQSQQSNETKTTSLTIKDTPFKDSKEMQQNLDTGNKSEKNASTATETPKSHYSDIEANVIAKNYLRAGGGLSGQESDSENLVTIAPTMAEDTKVDSNGKKITEGIGKPAKQNDIKDNGSTFTAVAAITTATAAAAAAVAAAAVIKRSSDINEMPDTDTQKTKGSKEILLSKLPILKRSVSKQSRSNISAASVKDKTNRSDSPDKDRNSIGHRDTDKSISILSGSKTLAASVSDKTKRNDSPDKHWDTVGHRDIDLDVDKDGKRTSLSSESTSTESVTDKTSEKRSDSPDKHLETTRHKDTEKRKPILSRSKTSVAPVTDKTKRTDSPDKHLENIGHRDTDKDISILSPSKSSASSVTDEIKRSDSPDKLLDTIGHTDTALGIHKDEKRTTSSSGVTSVTSVKDKTTRSDSPDQHLDNIGSSVTAEIKRSDSPDKLLNNIGHTDTELGIHKDEKRTTLSSGVTSVTSVKDKTTRSDSPDQLLDNIGQRDTEKGKSILSRGKTSAASVTDETKRSNSPVKHLDKVRYRDTELGIHNGEKRPSISSGPTYETDAWDAKISEPPSDKTFINETEKPNNDGKIDSYTESQAIFIGKGSMNFKAAPVIIENTQATINSEPLKEVYSETNFFGEPIETGHEFDPSSVPYTKQIASRLRKFNEDDGSRSTVSRELIGTKSVIYDTNEYIPNTSAKQNAERIPSSDKRDILPVDTVIPSIQSTSTLKSAMKKDTMSVELGFRSYLNDKNERVLQTFDAANAPKRLPNDTVTVLKSQIRISSNEIRIPVDSEHDMSIQIKKSNANQRVSISDSRFANVMNQGTVKQQRSPVQCSDAEMTSSEANAEVRKDNILENVSTDDHFIDYYEQELVPLQLIIKNLRDEIDVLAAQQLIFKDKLYCANKSKLPRLVHSNKKCFGCVKK